MKKIILFLLSLSFCAFAAPLFDSYEEYGVDSSATGSGFASGYSSPSSSNTLFANNVSKNKVYRNSFYMSFDVGIAYTSISDIEEDDYGWRTSRYKGAYDGVGANIDFKMGMLIKNFTAIYALFGVVTASGTYDLKIRDDDDYGWQKYSFKDVDCNHLVIGTGATLYPFRDTEESLYGLYAGFNFAIEIGGLTYGEDDGYSRYDNLFDTGNAFLRWQIEVGKEFNTTKRWKMGVGFSYANVTPESGGMNGSQNFFSLMFRMSRH